MKGGFTMCIFCQIINGEIPSKKIYEDEYTYAFLDIEPVSLGHTLIIPKVHAETIYDLSAEDMKNFSQSIPKVAKHLKETLNCDGLNILQNNGEYALQSVFHVHFHLIPRYSEQFDGFDPQFETPSNTDPLLSDEIHQKLMIQD